MPLPPGPRAPAPITTALFARRPLDALHRWHRRYGDVFTVRYLGFGTGVYVADPDAIRELLTGDQSDLLAGEANSILEPVLGKHSVLVLDGHEHLRQRKLLLPPFQGSHVAAFRATIRDVAEREIESWRPGQELVVRSRMRALSFEVICRAAFGVTEPARVERLRRALSAVIDTSSFLMAIPLMRADLGRLSPGGRLARRLGTADALLYEEIGRRRAEPDLAERADVLSLLLQARDEDGRAMTDAELRDELFTILAAGHETTATGLAFAIELLLRTPRALARLREAIDSGDDALPRRRRQRDAAHAPRHRRGRAYADETAHSGRLGASCRGEGLPCDRARSPPPGPLPGSGDLPPRALRRHGCRVLRVAAVRRGNQALHWRRAGPGRDVGGASRRRFTGGARRRA